MDGQQLDEASAAVLFLVVPLLDSESAVVALRLVCRAWRAAVERCCENEWDRRVVARFHPQALRVAADWQRGYARYALLAKHFERSARASPFSDRVVVSWSRFAPFKPMLKEIVKKVVRPAPDTIECARCGAPPQLLTQVHDTAVMRDVAPAGQSGLYNFAVVYVLQDFSVEWTLHCSHCNHFTVALERGTRQREYAGRIGGADYDRCFYWLDMLRKYGKGVRVSKEDADRAP
jgi:hypothetical protein